MKDKDSGFTRRKFLATAASVSAVLGASGCEKQEAKTGPVTASRQKRKWIRCGVIGTGLRGRELLSFVVNVPRVSVKAICDTIPDHLEFAKKITGSDIKTYSDYNRLLEEGSGLDAIFVASPLYEHSRMIVAALHAGKHVFCETALSRTGGECAEVVKTASSADRLLQFGYQGHFNSLFNKAIEVAKQGKLGQITHVSASWHMNDDGRLPVSDAKFEKAINWRMYREFSGGLMTEFGSHQIDFCNRLLGARPRSVVGLGGIDFWKDGREVPDHVNVIFDYPGGAKVVFTSLLGNAHTQARIEILGSKGTIALSLEGGRFFPEKPPVTAAVRSVEGLAPPSGPSFKLFPSSKDEGETIEVKETNSTYLQLESFFECIHEGRKPACGAEVARDATVPALAANEAIETERTVICDYQL